MIVTDARVHVINDVINFKMADIVLFVMKVIRYD